MKTKFKIILSLLFFATLFLPIPIFAQYDGTITNFDTTIKLNTDSSAQINERIIFDCTRCVDKHGIFRIIPTQSKKSDGTKIKNNIKLISITDQNGQRVKFSQTNNNPNKTVTYKIGDPNVTISGEKVYNITYTVDNVIRFDQADFDEFYWNLLGNYWLIPIQKFHAQIIFPQEISKQKIQITNYIGSVGSDKQLNDIATISDSDVNISYFKTLETNQGITTSIAFPKNIFTPHQDTFIEKFGHYIWLMIPIFTLIICFVLWKIYGDDPRGRVTIVPEFAPPDKLTPSQMGMLYQNGQFNQKFITAEIINLAVKGLITITETTTKIFLQSKKDYILKQTDKIDPTISDFQKHLIKIIFGSSPETKVSQLQKQFLTEFKELSNKATEEMFGKQYFTRVSLSLKKGMFIVSSALFVWSIYVTKYYNELEFSSIMLISFSFFMSFLILLIFAFLMPKRTDSGVETYRKIKGFKMFMDKAEKYRQRFFERENIFEQLLPYAIIFGLTKKWIKAFQNIYTKQGSMYASSWLFYSSGKPFSDIDNLTTSINSLSTSISQSISNSGGSSSGFGGGGFSGGGGGGGGGGSW